jgi:hypothetical protein
MVVGATVVTGIGSAARSSGSRRRGRIAAFRAGINAGGMRALGFDQPLIEKVCFKNWLRVLGRTWRAERQRRHGGRHCRGEASLRSNAPDLPG